VEARVLIDAERIRSIAREEKMGAAVVEKDYALTWLLKGFFLKTSQLRKSFVLKGGTAIRKAYFPGTWRFSEDLDFTVTGDAKDAEIIKKSLQDILDTLTAESGIAYSVHSFHANPGAVIGSVRFQGPLNHPNRIKLDISLSEKMALKPEARMVRSEFPDLPEFQILAYSLDEILAEKLRSIIQRGYSRDYYDVWRLMKESKFDRDNIKNLLVRKCELKEIEYKPELFFDKDRLDDARDHWISGLGHLVKELPDSDKVVSELREMLAFLRR
jgi:hypothetical protein